jgi:hypothetical protein
MDTIVNLTKHAFRGAHGATKWTKDMGSFYQLKAIGIEGKEIDFKDFAGNVALVTNVACF